MGTTSFFFIGLKKTLAKKRYSGQREIAPEKKMRVGEW
jgi:hypothetical protein